MIVASTPLEEQSCSLGNCDFVIRLVELPGDHLYLTHFDLREGERREDEMKGGRERGREDEMKGGRERGREDEMKGGRDRGREDEMKGGRERELREGGREKGGREREGREGERREGDKNGSTNRNLGAVQTVSSH